MFGSRFGIAINLSELFYLLLSLLFLDCWKVRLKTFTLIWSRLMSLKSRYTVCLCEHQPGERAASVEADFRRTNENRAQQNTPFNSRDVYQQQEMVSGTFGDLKHGLNFIFTEQHASGVTGVS